ncbi:FdtA/QdtA family cupin domain-containing protein [Oceanicoccus sp. KOV_DT_Chl]|uniref:sugar 3,4-ketoisomerase n=1 Tax=Oceanicoccus sp. KOV_DT_Chl TaxID=1904639 RepID=UPI000C7E42FB|nr:FdtA/QdtA family cupin domain-containing protein [Oceanicoccus sp. KOV_DT_Chl]
MNFYGIKDCKVVTLPKIEDERGSLTFIEKNNNFPFEIKRVFYLYGVPEGEGRGAHAHKSCHQFLVCLAGNLEVHVDDGANRKIFSLTKPWEGLHVPPSVWAAESNFSDGAICLVMASDYYDEDDYIRSYDQFIVSRKELLEASIG